VVGLFHLKALKYAVLGQRHPILPEMRFLSLDKVLEFIPFPPINMVKQKDAGTLQDQVHPYGTLPHRTQNVSNRVV
jgi:hypothetical protein